MNKKFLIRLSAILIFTVLITGCRGHVDPPTPPSVVTPQPIIKEYSVNIPGENLTALSKVTDCEYKCSHPYGGDNNKNLYFTVSTFGTKHYSNIYMKDNVLSASMSQKTSGNNYNTHAAYCAATNMLAFSGQFEGSNHWDIYMINSSRGNALTQVTSSPNTEDCYPDFSRDGRMIVYQKGLVSSEIWIKKLNTNENIMLGTGKRPSFSPDGRKIVYIRSSADGKVNHLWIMNNDGSSQVQLTNANQGSIDRPRFSPDGKHIVFQSYKKEKGDNDLYVIDTDGNNLSQLTINKSYDGEPYWASDGYIYFTSDRGGKDSHYQIWRFRFGSYAKDVREMGVITTSDDTETLPPPSEFKRHIVKEGETITDIAKRYGVTVKDIVKWNNLLTMTITPGMELKVSAQE